MHEPVNRSQRNKCSIHVINNQNEQNMASAMVNNCKNNTFEENTAVKALVNSVQNNFEGPHREDVALNGASSGQTLSYSAGSSRSGSKFKLVNDGDVHVCRLNHTRTVISKLLSSKFLRRWEVHRLTLGDSAIVSRTSTGFLEEPIPYAAIEDIYAVTRWDCHQKFCIRIVVFDGSILLQTSNSYLRDQWFHSIIWKKNIFKYQRLLRNTRRIEVMLKEIKIMVDFCLSTPLQDECIYQTPLELISDLLPKISNHFPKSVQEEVLVTLVPLLEKNHPPSEICDFFSKQCKDNPRSNLIMEVFTPVVQRILKHNVDFGKYPNMRMFLQDFIVALGAKNEGLSIVRQFAATMHGSSSTCPHPRVLPNLVSVCLAAIYAIFENKKSSTVDSLNEANCILLNHQQDSLNCFLACFDMLASYEDWRPFLSQLLQPIPFPDRALSCEKFIMGFQPVIRQIIMDPRCEVHQTVLGIRDGKEGWFHLFYSGNLVCQDDGLLWSEMLESLVKCCCRRKRFLSTLNKMLGQLMLLALRDNNICQETLCFMLELEVVENNDHQLQIVTTLQSTASGRKHYTALCERQMHLRELQQKGGPRKLTLPSRSTDADVAKLLSCGSFGNLECLSLAFTQVTSACAEQLIKLPSLKYLNLWSTQFGDLGLQLISEHLHKLQVLNLCETPVTDKGLVSLTAMKNLRKLNLNSTSLSAYTFEALKQKLPALQECDIRYTDAW
uniref:C-Maf-inducing protein PH domain-containing protein n=1 Tax=Strigamia maritima TaxID=126957 RepID=T1J4Y4_STRMM